MKIIIFIFLIGSLLLLFWGSGDVNQNGRVSSGDLYLVGRHINDIEKLSFFECLSADVNKDLIIDDRDLQMIMDKVLRRIP